MARRLLSEVELEARHLSSTAWAFARTLLLEMPLLVRMANASLKMDDLGPQAISNMLQ